MGSGISNISADSLPLTLNENEVENICGDNFDQKKFDAIKDDNGYVTREIFISTVTMNIEQEVFNVYLTYCQNSELDSQAFGRLCRDAKLLNKSFSRRDAGVVFIHIKQKEKSAHTKAISYNSFRQAGIPEIAAKKRCRCSTDTE